MRTIIAISLLILLAAVACGSETPTSTATARPEPTNATRPITPTPTPTIDEVTNTPTPTATPEPTAMPTEVGFGPGMYLVGERLQPGIYAGKTGIGLLDSCYWARLSGASGEFSDLIANDNAVGQFYVEVLATDKFFEIGCDITPLHAWPMPDEPLSKIEPGIYLVGRDISPGTYRGEAGTDVLDSCYWARLSGVSGEFSDLIANDNAVGQYFVSIQDSDYAFATGCALESAESSS